MNRKILLVDNDKFFLEFVGSLLSEEGYEVETATDGIEVLEKIHSIKPDGIILDLIMENFDGDQVTIHNVRNFRYRSEEDFDETWETRVYDLSTIRSLDLYFSYWGPRDIAHTMLSFGFENGDYLALSVETRKEVGEAYDPLRSRCTAHAICCDPSRRFARGLRRIRDSARPFHSPRGAFRLESPECGPHSRMATGLLEGSGRKSRAITVAWNEGP